MANLSGTATRARPTPDDALDPELESHYNAFHELNTLIRDGWQIGFLEDIGLEQRTHRPKPYSAGHDVIRRRGYHWLSENGAAERSRSAGFIEDYLDGEWSRDAVDDGEKMASEVASTGDMEF